MITVIKRDGRKVPFDRNKIVNAVLKAFLATYGDTSEYAKKKAENIAQYVENEIPQSELSVEQIQGYVEHGLMALKDKSVAKNYILYRKERDNARKNTIDQVVDEIVGNKSEYWLTENSNKDAYLVTTQRDYIAGAVSTDICKRRIFPKDVIEAHEQGIIHIHDMDYTLQPIHNCFSGDTKFVTDTGIKTFAECGDGTKVNVLDMNGDWRVATVKFYGEQHLQTVTFESQGVQKTVHCTPNHRWILADGTVTTELKVGDKLTLLKQQNRHVSYEANAFCEGYVLGKGFDYNIGTNEGTAVVLSEKEYKYINMFKDAGFVASDTNSSDGYVFLENPMQAVKKTVLRDYKTYDDSTLMAIFAGLYAASADSAGTIYTHMETLAQMIRDISAISGYHILEEAQEKTAEGVTKFSFRFFKSQSAGDNWTVVSIEDNEEGLHPVWCVEEPVTHSFTLEGGIVTGNCDLVNLEDMLQNGTVISKTKIDKPHKFSTACNIATQIIAQVASSQLGGQSISLAHLSPFVEDSRNKFRSEYPGVSDEMIEHMVHNDIVAGVQTLQYQIITLMTTNGQAPFITVYMNLAEVPEGREREDLALVIEEVLRQRILGVKNEVGVYITPAFPKLIYALDEMNMEPDSKYYYLTRLAAECTSKRMVPDYISNKIQRELKHGDTYTCMGCRSFLTVDETRNGFNNIANAKNYKPNEPKYYGRFNQGVVTINLPDVALSSGGDFDKFWEIYDERLELCHKALKVKHNRLVGVSTNVAPILWQHGALARLGKDETIDKLLYGGYSTISLGYAGLYECVKYMTGESHTSEKGKPFALAVMQKLNDVCNKWKSEEDIAYSPYGAPIETTVFKFAKKLQERFGIIPEITDHDYITNSYHVNVREKIDAFSKLKFEAEFQKLSPGGYFETQPKIATLKLCERMTKRCLFNKGANGGHYKMEIPCQAIMKIMEGVQTKCRLWFVNSRSAQEVRQIITVTLRYSREAII